MRRHTIAERQNWPSLVEDVGFNFHSLGKVPSDGIGTYWYEKACYELDSKQVDQLEADTNELHRICLEAVDHVAANPQLWSKFGISQEWGEYISLTWQQGHPYFYGRFDLAYDGKNPAKMLEYNADTPTLLIESSLVQWFWLQDKYPNKDQFNSIHEKMLANWQHIKELNPTNDILHFSAYEDLSEEYMTVTYMADTAVQAGFDVKFCALPNVGYNGSNFVDHENVPIKKWFKLYPWEWMVTDEFGKHCLDNNTAILEPVWKMLLSNKAILAVLWDLFPNHPNLLPASFDSGAIQGNYIKKPILAREGANIEIVKNNQLVAKTDGTYGSSPCVYQTLFDLPKFDDQYVMLGSWVIGSESAGIVFREDTNPIIVNRSKVVPHFFS